MAGHILRESASRIEQRRMNMKGATSESRKPRVDIPNDESDGRDHGIGLVLASLISVFVVLVVLAYRGFKLMIFYR